MRIENYFFANKEGVPVIPTEESEERPFLIGYIYGRPGKDDGSLVRTSRLISWDDKVAHTSSGSVYELYGMNADYAEYVNAVNGGDIIITDWRIVKGSFLKDDHKKYSDVRDMFRHGLEIIGTNTKDGEMISGEIIGQEGNYLTIVTSDKETIRCFVVWRDMEFGMQAIIQLGILEIETGLDYDDFEESFILKSRPKFQFTA